MADANRKYIQEIYELCGTDSILVIGYRGVLERVSCPFMVMPIRNIGDLQKGLNYAVNAVKLSQELIDVYIIKNKAYYHFNFRLLGRIDPNTGS